MAKQPLFIDYSTNRRPIPTMAVKAARGLMWAVSTPTRAPNLGRSVPRITSAANLVRSRLEATARVRAYGPRAQQAQAAQCRQSEVQQARAILEQALAQARYLLEEMRRLLAEAMAVPAARLPTNGLAAAASAQATATGAATSQSTSVTPAQETTSVRQRLQSNYWPAVGEQSSGAAVVRLVSQQLGHELSIQQRMRGL